MNEKPKKKKNKQIIEAPQEDEQIFKKPKKSKKSKQTDKVKKNKQISNDAIEDEIEHYIDDIPAQTEPVTNQAEDPVAGKSSNEDGIIHWPEQDITELFRRMEICLPENDTLSHSTRVEKLHWEEVSKATFLSLCTELIKTFADSV